MPGAAILKTFKKRESGEPLSQTDYLILDSFGLALASADNERIVRASLPRLFKSTQSPADPAINRQASSAPAAKQAARPAPGRASQRDYRIKRGPSGGGRASVLASELEPGRKTLLGG